MATNVTLNIITMQSNVCDSIYIMRPTQNQPQFIPTHLGVNQKNNNQNQNRTIRVSWIMSADTELTLYYLNEEFYSLEANELHYFIIDCALELIINCQFYRELKIY